MSSVRTKLGELEVRVDGTLDPRRRVAVLWHSLFVDDRSWDRVAPALAAQRTLVRITGPGHGGSEPGPRRFDLGDCVTAALQVLLELGHTGPVDWVGDAWGGHVGILLAARHPRHVRSLAAFNAPVQPLSRAEARGPRLLAAVLRSVGAIRVARDGVVAALLSERTRAEDVAAVAYVHECLRTADRAALAQAIRSVSLDRPDLRPLLPRVIAPTVFVTSPEDDLWTPAQAEAATALMPEATAVAVAGARHLTPLESPGETAELVTSLWART